MAGTVSAFYATPVATIAAAGTKTGAIGFGSYASGIFALPTGFQGTSMSFEVSHDGTTFYPFHDDDGIVALTVEDGVAYAIPLALFGALFIKLVSGSTEDAARSIQLMLKY